MRIFTFSSDVNFLLVVLADELLSVDSGGGLSNIGDELKVSAVLDALLTNEDDALYEL